MGKYIADLVSRVPELSCLHDDLVRTVEAIAGSYSGGHKVMTCGNGGSAADAEHIVGELMKGFLLERKLEKHEINSLLARGCPRELAEKLQMGIPAISLVSGVSLPSAFANDVCAQAIFAQQVFNLGKAKDVLLAISTSGNSRNVLAAAHVARAMDITVIGMTGERPGRLGRLSDITLRAPSALTPRIQEFHVCMYHAICADLEDKLFQPAESGRQEASS